jgi:hypothetical protein
MGQIIKTVLAQTAKTAVAFVRGIHKKTNTKHTSGVLKVSLRAALAMLLVAGWAVSSFSDKLGY